MRQVLAVVFTLATLGWGAAQQQPGMGPQNGPSQPSQPSAQTPDASQSQPAAPNAASPTGQASQQTAPDNGSQTQVANKPITEGCLGGSAPNFNITDKAGAKYDLVLPEHANASVLTPHVGESVLVMGDVTAPSGSGKDGSINVLKIGKGSGSCSASTAKPPSQ